MNEFKHTPHHWKVFELYGFFSVWQGSGDEAVEIAAIRHINDDPHHKIEEANAKLIAASPDLLDALIDCLDLFDALNTTDFDCILKARAAIAKATQ